MKTLIALLVASLAASAIGEEKTGMAAVRLMEQGKTQEALLILETLAEKDDAKAMVQLGLYYYEGNSVKQDYAKAMDWWLKAFSNENADAFVNLGVMHRDGHGVPQNKKIAYCVFLATHMCGLGSESTQHRANSCLRRMIAELSKADIKDCLSNYTVRYVTAYLEARGQMKGIPKEYGPSKTNPALKDTDWWMDEELDAIYGPASEEEMRKRQDRDKQREAQREALQHTLIFQVRFSKESAMRYRSYDVITDEGMGGGPIAEKKLQVQDKYLVYEDDTSISANQHRYVTVENEKDETLVFTIKHPVKPSPSDWSEWQKADCVLKDGMDKFALLQGGKPKSEAPDVSSDMPELRFKVVKK
jgi:hypothetical protein